VFRGSRLDVIVNREAASTRLGYACRYRGACRPRAALPLGAATMARCPGCSSRVVGLSRGSTWLSGAPAGLVGAHCGGG
jgi:hypothetical protein